MKSRDAAFAAVLAGALAAYNNAGGEQPWRQRWYPAINLGATGALLAAATASGLTAADVGLSPGRVPAGLRGAAARPPRWLRAGWAWPRYRPPGRCWPTSGSPV